MNNSYPDTARSLISVQSKSGDVAVSGVTSCIGSLSGAISRDVAHAMFSKTSVYIVCSRITSAKVFFLKDNEIISIDNLTEILSENCMGEEKSPYYGTCGYQRVSK